MTNTNLIEALEKAEGPRGVIPWEYFPQYKWLRAIKHLRDKRHRATWREVQRQRYKAYPFVILAFAVGFWWIIPVLISSAIWVFALSKLPWKKLHPGNLGTFQLIAVAESFNIADKIKAHEAALRAMGNDDEG